MDLNPNLKSSNACENKICVAPTELSSKTTPSDTVQPCDTTQVRSIGAREGTSILGNRGYTDFVIYFHLTCGLPIWLGFFSYKDVAAGFGNFLVPQGSLMSCNIIYKCGGDSLMFQNPFLIRIPYSS
ncbi:hypothetical protein D5086_029444 [Populus alba]|uniref:Uncharacterized protein n=1 Tax=Populus alba TaxID=43335 RepID=A0ACC4AU81_POPAL